VNALLFDFNLVPRCLVSEVLGRGLGLDGWLLGLGLEACVLNSITDYKHQNISLPAYILYSLHVNWPSLCVIEACEDKDSQCGGNPGWPQSWCTDKNVFGGMMYDTVNSKCPKMCGHCGQYRCPLLSDSLTNRSITSHCYTGLYKKISSAEV